MNIHQLKVRALTLMTVTVIAVALVGGCKGKDPVVGKWADDKGTTVEFKADKTFSQGSGDKAVLGKWDMTDKKVAINVETIGGKPADQVIQGIIDMISKMNPKGASPADIAKAKSMMKNISLTLSDDSKTLTMAPAEGSKGPGLTLKKQDDK
jgi:hypothetical protein